MDIKNSEPKDANTERTEARTHGTHGRHSLIHGRTTNTIISAAYRVHGALGPGLLERVYQTCLCHELRRMGISFESEKTLPVIYDGIRMELGYRVDLFVEDKVIVEVKAVDAHLPVHESQLLTYLRLSGARVGLLPQLRGRSSSGRDPETGNGIRTVNSVVSVSSVLALLGTN